MKDGGAGGTRTPDPLHAMQVLSQLSYNPTSVHLLALYRTPLRPDSSPGCSAGEFRVARAPACTDPALAVNEACAYYSRVFAFAEEYISR